VTQHFDWEASWVLLLLATPLGLNEMQTKQTKENVEGLRLIHFPTAWLSIGFDSRDSRSLFRLSC